MNPNIVFLDGGFLFEINKKYNDLGQKAVLQNTNDIYSIYEGYINLGCSIITTNNYGFKPNQSNNWEELCDKSGDIFINLKKKHPYIKIFGSLPPFFPSYVNKPVNKEFISFYTTLINIINGYVDEFLIETSISIEHIECICSIIKNLYIEKNINISFYPLKIDNNNLLKFIEKYSSMIDKLFINCCNFSKMKSFYNEYLYKIINEYKTIKFGFYLNNIDEKKYKENPIVKDLQEFKTDNNEYDDIKDFIKDFKEIYIGGCCGYGIDEMRMLINHITNN